MVLLLLVQNLSNNAKVAWMWHASEGSSYGTSQINFPITFTSPHISVCTGRNAGIFTSTSNGTNREDTFSSFLLDSVTGSSCKIQKAGSCYVNIIGY